MSDDLHDLAAELRQAAALEGAELGEWWAALADLLPMVADGASDEFAAAYEKELRAEHQRFKEEFRIDNWTDTETRTVTYRELRHISEYE